MLAVFAPQILLYGLAVVLYGILQAHRRFTAPRRSPPWSQARLVIAAGQSPSSLGGGAQNHLVICLWSAELAPSGWHDGRRRRRGAAALGPDPAAAAAARTPGRRRPAGAGGGAGVAALIAQDASLVVIIVLANGHGGQGALVLYNYGWQCFVPYAVLALPIATSVFPDLSAVTGPPHHPPPPPPGR